MNEMEMISIGEEGVVEEVSFVEYVLDPENEEKEHLERKDEFRKLHAPKKVKRFQCKTCNLMCSSPSTLQVHIRSHTGERPYQCSYCDYRGAAPFAVRAHMRIHTGERPFACNVCNFRASHSTDLTIHMRRHTGEKPYACTECDYKCASKSALQAHLTTHSKVKHLNCPECEYKCSSKQLLNFHLRTHLVVKPFKCDFCKYSAVTKTLIKVHMRVHTGEKPYKCNICDYACRAKSGLRSHKKKHEKNPLNCRHCSFTATSIKSVVDHERVHSQTKKVISRSGKNKATASESDEATGLSNSNAFMASEETNAPQGLMRLKVSRKPLDCLMCNETFSQITNWLSHLSMHGSGPLKFRCRSCKFITASKKGLMEHRKEAHEYGGGTTWDCSYCKRLFTRKDNLRRHIAKNHGIKLFDQESRIIAPAADSNTVDDEFSEVIIKVEAEDPSENVSGTCDQIERNQIPAHYEGTKIDSNLSNLHGQNRFVEISEDDAQHLREELSGEKPEDVSQVLVSQESCEAVDIDDELLNADATNEEVTSDQYLQYFDVDTNNGDDVQYVYLES